MDLRFNTSLAEGYKSNSQIARVLTEDWLGEFFTLNEIYAFADEVHLKHPDNHHIHDKLRQQLQFLRDKNIIEFISRGKYRRL